ncbi:MAG TPA: Ldh family oxidoreductase, partial [Quisquiliibacterium sp.]|nr:Ldh family oxidoreductase [Quisquiliibacterium sp.]
VQSPHDALEVVRRDAAGVIAVKTTKLGGLTRSKEVVAIARTAGVACHAATSLEGPIGTMASLHLACAEPGFNYGSELFGPWLVRRAIDWARPRAQMHGAATIVIRRSHHIACLAAYLEPLARAGLVAVLYSSDPAVASVAPFGGTQAVFTPNPLAVGIPTSGDPVLIDISASVTTNGMSGRLKNAGRQGEHAWWLDALGQPTRDPAVLFAQPPGTILPLGGLDAGHKGYGLALMIEALTGGLAGYGRADLVEGWGATVHLQLYDPAAFAGAAPFTWQTDWIVDACHRSAPRVHDRPVRLPGERGLALKRAQLRDGVALQAGILPGLAPLAERLGVALPDPLR